jgi:threonine dehydrogenase-like Zn-dependent dehydrogenase
VRAQPWVETGGCLDALRWGPEHATTRNHTQVIAVDGVPERRAKAAAFGATAVDVPDAAAAVTAATDGRGADVTLELVGSSGALRLAFQLLRPGGVLSSIGVHTDAQWPFSPVDAYNKNLTLRCGRCPARHYMRQLLPLVQEQAWPFTDIITHRLPLSQGVQAYDMFDRKLSGCIKVVLDPWAA